MQQNQKIGAAIAIAIAALFLLLVISGKLTAPDHRDAAERVGDAIRTLPDGADKATDQLGDRTTGQRMGDTLRGIGK